MAIWMSIRKANLCLKDVRGLYRSAWDQHCIIDSGTIDCTCDRFEQIVDTDCPLCRFCGFGVNAFVVEISPIVGFYNLVITLEGNYRQISMLFGCASDVSGIHSFSTRSH